MLFIKNGTINTVTNGVIQGDILIEKGKIVEIGADLVAPLDAKTIDATGKLVFPGFIDAHTHLGLWEDGMGFEGADGNEETDPITPHLNPIDGINPMERSFEEARNGGITSVCSTPGSANVMGGQCIAIKTVGRRIDKMVIKNPVASKIAFGENPKSCYGQEEKAPQTRMAIAAMLRETLKEAEEYLDAILMHEEDDENEKPDYDIKMESLLPVLRKEIPFKVHAHRADDMFTAIRIAKEFDLKLTLDHCTEGHLIPEYIKKSGFSAIVGPSLTNRSKVELKNRTFKTAGVLNKYGVDVAITTDHPVVPIQYLPICAGFAAKEGLGIEEALKAITINPAKICGVEDMVGSIEVGKDADIAIFTGNPMEVFSETLYTIIDGNIVYSKE